MEGDNYDDSYNDNSQGEDVADEAGLWQEVSKELPANSRAIQQLLGKKLASHEEEEEEEGNYGLLDETGSKAAARDAQDLSHMLLSEINAPDLMPYRLFERLKGRTRAAMDMALSNDSSLSALEKAICEMDANRFEFELVNMNRTRLKKIAKYSTYFLRNDMDRMSHEEIDFARQHEQLLESHFRSSFLDRLPVEFSDLRNQNEEEVYPKPDLRSFVIFNSPEIALGQLVPGEEGVGIGQTFAGPYNLVKEHLLRNEVNLV